MSIDILLAIIFITLLSVWLYTQRKNLVIQKILYPLLYFIMYRTKIGLKLMDKLGQKHKRLVGSLAYLGVAVGFVGMVLIAFELIKNVVTIFVTKEAIPGVGIVLPIEAKGVFYVPFVYWIIAIFFVAVVHEFSHGVVARRHGIPIKSSGFAFLGIVVPILPAAFVEPDEKKLKKAGRHVQLSVFAAGPFANIVWGFIFLAIFIFVFNPISDGMIDIQGLQVMSVVNDTGEGIPAPAYSSGLREAMLITHIDSHEIESLANFSDIIGSRNPGDSVTITTNVTDYTVVLDSHPDDESRAYLGMSVTLKTDIKESVSEKYGSLIAVYLWFLQLVYWLFLLNLGIGLFNLVPLGPIDGGRMLQLVLTKVFGQENGHRIWKAISIVFLVLLIVIIGSSFF